MLYKIQSLVFPHNQKHQLCKELFYRGDSGIFDTTNNSFSLGYAQHCDLTTYINACSYRKWKEYTCVDNLSIELDFVGDVEISFVGYHKQSSSVTKVIFDSLKYSHKQRKRASYKFPENDEQMVGVEITALSNCTLYGGGFFTEIKKKSLRNIVLSIATTTCGKEEFIKENVKLIKNNLLSDRGELSKNLYLHVVDNGRSLSKKDINGAHVFLHPNPNVGGSGGFARGMMESLRQTPAATHVLLMDDDVLVLPESIARTYNLLRLQKETYASSFISGAMLYYEDPKKQHEDIGTVNDIADFIALKGQFDHSDIADSLENESQYPQVKNSYSAWWYCCMPVSAIKKNGLPLPIFIRCDDVEYGLRCNPDTFITMNGICIWHMGFTTKYNPAMDLYQSSRNLLIAQSASGVLKNVNFIETKIYSYFRKETIRFNYGAAELVVRALEDYLKGPDFIKSANGEEILTSNAQLNPSFSPLSLIEGGESFTVSESIGDPPLSFSNRLYLKITRNGNRFAPRFLFKPGIVPISFAWELSPQRIARHTKILAVNPYDKTGAIYALDKKRYASLQKRYKAAMKQYKKNGEKIAKEYRDAFPEFTSEKFWDKYLSLN